jgi:hypothetical protein
MQKKRLEEALNAGKLIKLGKTSFKKYAFQLWNILKYFNLKALI